MEERPLEDILAELLAGEEEDEVAADAGAAGSSKKAAAEAVPTKVLAAAATIPPAQQPEQQQQQGNGTNDLDLLLGELLSAQQQQQQRRRPQPPTTAAPGKGPSHAARNGLAAPAAASNSTSLAGAGGTQLMDLGDEGGTSVAAAAAAGPDSSASDTAAEHAAGAGLAQQLAPASAPAAAKFPGAAAAAPAAVGADTGAAAVLSPLAAAGAAGVDSSSSSSSSAASGDDDMLDMLHDMAEVLEVEQPQEEPQAAAELVAETAAPAAPEPAAAGEAASSLTSSLPAQQQQQQQHADDDSQVAVVNALLLPPAPPAAPATAVAGEAAAGRAKAALPPHELALQQAWEYEEMLYHGGLAARQAQQTQQQQQRQQRPCVRLDPQARLTELLSDAKADWNPAGRPAASGTAMIGGAVLLRLESLAGLFAGAAGSSAGGGSSSGGGAAAAVGGAVGGMDWSQVLAAALAPHGPLQVVAASGPFLAGGTAAGSALVFQLPQPQQGPAAAAAAQQQGSGGSVSSGQQNPAAGHSHSVLPGGAAMWQLGEGLGGDAVTCLGFSVVLGAGEPLWLAVGHASGALTVWELQRRGPRQVACIAQHGARITLTSFLPSKGTSLLLSGDARGRLCLHTFSSLLLRTNVSSRVLANGQYGPLLGVTHLAPFTMAAPGPAAAAGGGCSGRGATWSAGVQGLVGSTPPLSPKGLGPPAGANEAALRALFEDGTWRVGDGVFCLLTPTHAYIARLKPPGQDLVMLFSIPQPTPGPQAAVPTAAWLPHARKASPGFRVWSGAAAEDVTAGACNSSNSSSCSVVVPVAVLALGWGSRLVMFDVPLIGDHVALGEPGAADVPNSSTNALAAAAAAAGQQLRRGGAGSFSASRAAQRAQHALETLNPTTAAQIAGRFPLSISATWSGGTAAAAAAASAPGRRSSSPGSSGCGSANPGIVDPLLGPTEPLPILGVHWLDADAVAVVCQQGFSSLLLVLGFTSSSSSSFGGGSLHKHNRQPQQQCAVLQVQEQVEWMDQPVDRQWGLSGGLATWGRDCHGSVVGAGPRTYLLGQQGGVFCARLMPWSERLKTLQDVRKFKLGLYYALRFHHTMKQQQQRSSHASSSSFGEPHPTGGGGGSAGGLKPRGSVGGLGRSEGLGAEPQQLEQWMLSLMLGHASSTLQEAAAQRQQQGQHQQHQQQQQLLLLMPADDGMQMQPPSAVCAAAEICVCACLLLGRPDVLFGRVYPLFARPPAAATADAAAAGPGLGAVAAFVDALEVAVLSDLLQGLDPEVMQALVQHCVSVGQPERVEGCVLHLSITSLDLDQVIRLCEGCGLYSALAYIHNTALADYRKPLMDLVAAVAGAGSPGEAVRYCYKLLVYLRCCFRGLAFPPGTGSLPSSPPGALDSIKATLLGSLLFADSADLLSEWTHSGGRAAATAAALTAASRSSGSSDSNNSDSSRRLFCRGLSDPHPALQLLLSVDVPAVVCVLSETTSGWDAVETDLRAAAGKPASELESVLVATQVVVNAIIALLEAGKFQQWQSSNGSSSNSGQPSGSSVAMKYISDLLAAGRVTVKPSFVLKLLEHLVNQAAAATTAAAVSACAAELEQQFISIINVVGINPPPAAATQQQQQFDAASLTAPQAQAALVLAARAGFLRAAAAIHHLAGSYGQALAAYLQLAQRHQEQQQQQQQYQAAGAAGGRAGSADITLAGAAAAPAGVAAAAAAGTGEEVFEYIERFLSSNSSSSFARKRFMSAVLQHAVQLIQVDPAATAALLLRHQPDQQVPLLVSLQQQPLLQFRFLRAAMQQALLLQRTQQAAAAAAAGELPSAAAGGHERAVALAHGAEGSSVAAAAAGAERLLLERSEVADLYVRLLVQFEPHGVMPFLQSHHNYNVAAAIKACAAGGVSDAEAFLHERLGDLEAALRLHMAAVEESNSRLVTALLSGRIPVLQLPCGLGLSSAAGAGLRQQGSSMAGIQGVPETGDGSSSSSSSSRGAGPGGDVEQIPWGLGPLLRQLQAAQDAVHPAAVAAVAGRSPGAESVQPLVVAAAAAVAASLLQQLPLALGSRRQPHQMQHQHQQHPLMLSHHGAGGAVSSSAAPLQSSWCVCMDLHKAWMGELSPRLKLKGLGCSTVHSSLQGAAHSAVVGMGGGSGAATAAVAGAAAEVPQELIAAWNALQAALAFCKRNTKSSTSNSSSVADRSAGHTSTTSRSSRQHEGDAAAGGKQLWFGLMDVYVARVRSLQAAAGSTAADASAAFEAAHKQQWKQQQQHGDLRHVALGSSQPQQQQQAEAAAAGRQLLGPLAAAAAGQLPLRALLPLLLASATALAGCVAHDLFSLLLDEVVCVMADHLPLLDIVGRVLQQHGSEQFGEFRSTLLGLFGATAYESAIMQAANRLITGDAFAAVRRSYLLRQLARQPVQDEEQQQQGAGQGIAAGSSSSSRKPAGPSMPAAAENLAAAALTAAAATANSSVSSSSSMVHTALMLGVLGRGSSHSSSSRRAQQPQLLHLQTQADRDIISGILGPGGIRMQLQPAGPAAGHLPGVAAEFRKAAIAVHSSHRVFKGEVDLALEIAALNASSSRQHAGQRGGAAGKGASSGGGRVGLQLQDGGQPSAAEARQAGAEVDAGGSPVGRASFDVDELLAWSQNNL